MGWWTSVVNGATYLSNGFSTVTKKVTNTATWLWNNASLKKITLSVFTFGANTVFQAGEQFMAWRTAGPALLYNPQVNEIVNNMAYVAYYDVLPLVGINVINNGMQSYFRKGYPEDAALLAPYSIFLSGLTLINIGVTAYTWQRGLQASARVLVLDSVGPPAFNSNKKTDPSTLCTEKKCNVKRKIKGWGREPLILLSNDALTWGISCVPYGGKYIARILRVLVNGRYMTRLATPERCERHKAMMQESVLALGLTYEATSVLMDLLFEYTIGMPPFLFHRTLRHLLLLLHVNMAANMNIPLVEPKDATIWFDPLNIYEWICRFVADVIFAGLMKRIPIDFARPKDAPPLIPLSPALQLMTRTLNSDIEQEKPTPSTELAVQNEPAVQELSPSKPWVLPEKLRRFEGLLNDPVKTLKPWILPPMFRSTDDLINDPIVSKHWIALREGGIAGTTLIRLYGKNNAVAVLSWAPKTLASALYLKYGISKTVTRTLLMLSKEDDFWDFVLALQKWFERHNVKIEVKLDDNQQLALLGEKKEAPSPNIETTPIVAATQVVTNRQKSSPSDSPVLRPEALLTTRTRMTTISDKPDSFLTTRKRVDKSKHEAPPVNTFIESYI